MIQRRFWASVWLFCCLLAKAESKPVDTENSCITYAFPEDDLTAQRKIMSRLDSFLEKNQDKRLLTLSDVLAVTGNEEKDLDIKIDKEDPLDAVLLRYLIFLHQDIRTLLEVKAPLLRYLKKNTDLKLSEKSSVFPFVGKRNIFTPTDSTVSTDLKLSEKSSVSPFIGKSNIFIPTDSTVRAMDCSEHLVSGRTKSGVYEIYPFTFQRSRPVKVFCDMETDGGGWTVFLSRAKVSKPVNFYRNWNDYKTGFGTPGEEHWLGNEHLHTLTSTRNYILRAEAQDGSGRESWGEWNTFSVDSESNLYKLTAVDRSPNNIADDSWFTLSTGRNFTTFDRDNDLSTSLNCAVARKGGWWYSSCSFMNPTGLHDKKDKKGIRFYSWSKQDAAIRYATHVQLKIRPK